MVKPCPKCGATTVAVRRGVGAAPAGSDRIECGGCGRFVGWKSGSDTGSEKSSGSVVSGAVSNGGEAVATSEELGTPDAWLYVSKRLDLEYLPNTPLWSLPVISITAVGHSPALYYRLCAAVLAWLEAAGEILERKLNAGELYAYEVTNYVEHMQPVWAFAQRWLSEAAVSQARRLVSKKLPEPVVEPERVAALLAAGQIAPPRRTRRFQSESEAAIGAADGVE